VGQWWQWKGGGLSHAHPQNQIIPFEGENYRKRKK